MSRDWQFYFDDMVAGCEKVLRFTAGMNRREFFDDEKTHDAVVRNIQIVGEAAKHIPLEVRLKMPDIEWRKIAGMRDLIVHAYFGIDPDILWLTVEAKVPELLRTLQAFKVENQP
jgi:uncharacterized protein with HEPN domain